MDSSLLAFPNGYRIDDIRTDAQSIHIAISSQSQQACCPVCHIPSLSVHSQHIRTLADLPCSGRQVVLTIHLHKWRCRVASCPRRIFAERVDPLAQAWARMTTRMRQALESIGVAVNGRGGARLAQQLGMPITPSSLLNLVRRLPDPPMEPPEVIGIDEWSYRRGKRFGTIIVDLQRRRVIDLLPDRDVVTVATWLAAHPTIRVVSRDRSREFARAVELGAPNAMQVIDRFHVFRNLVDKLPALLARCFADIHAAHPPLSSPVALSSPPTPVSGSVTILPTQHQFARYQERIDRYQQIHQWHQQGLSYREIGHRLRLAPATVWYWLQKEYPTSTYRKRASALDPYEDYVRERWGGGCRNGQTLWRELQALGYSGSARMLYQLLIRLRQAPLAEEPFPPPELLGWLRNQDPLTDRRYTLTQAQWLFVKWPAELTDDEQQHLTVWCQANATLATAYFLVQQFRHLIHHPSSSMEVETWLVACEASRVRELVRFAKSLRDEGKAVINGLTHFASNGQTEGHVNRLKLIKRQHFGRAAFPLLRQHVLQVTGT